MGSTSQNTLVPKHVAIIMDGNRRWARQHGLPVLEGHRQGAKVLKRVVEACPALGVRYLTVYAFSSENWGRPRQEVVALMALMQDYLEQEIDELDRQGVCLRVIGERNQLSHHLNHLIQDAETRTRSNTTLGLQVAISYGGRCEILRATKKIAAQVAQGELSLQDIEADMFETFLDTHGIPDPDLLIRTSGENRLSNYLLWQLAYTEFLFIDPCWPDFGPEALKEAIIAYGKRKRRFGCAA